VSRSLEGFRSLRDFAIEVCDDQVGGSERCVIDAAGLDDD